MNTSKNKKSGFTIVELAIVIVILAVLVTLVAVGVGMWRNQTAETEVKNGLKNTYSALESYKNFGSGYPSSIPANISTGPNVTITLAWSSATTFCVNGTSTAVTGVNYYIKNNSEPVSGTCPAGP